MDQGAHDYHLDALAGERLSVAGVLFLVNASRETTAGAFAIIEEIDPLDTPLHVHANEDELFYVIEGEHVFQVGEEEFNTGPGAFVFAPRHVPHAHQRRSSRTGRFLTMVSPAGFQGFYRERSAAETAGGAGPEAYESASSGARGFGAAFHDEDFDTMTALVSAKVVFEDPRGAMEGRDAWLAAPTASGAEPSHMHSTREDQELEACGDAVVWTATRLFRWKENGELAHSQRSRATLSFGEDGAIVGIRTEPNVEEEQ